MKIHISYPFKDGPWGGANQFLKAIKMYFIEKESYAEKIEEADIVLFNSSPLALDDMHKVLFQIKKEFSEKIFINRIDGPVFYIRDRNIYIDKAFYKFNDTLCDGTIFQSNWSREKNYDLGMKKNYFETTILNAPNSNIFNNQNKKTFDKHQKIKLISTSWSSNIKKGFEVYQWMDTNLDFKKYEMTFIGNSPVKFKNIILKKPMDSQLLASELKKNDIFITASQSDPCSNALIEAMHCGLPAIGLDDGGHTEIISNGGEVFHNADEIPQKLNMIINNYSIYQKNINLPTVMEIGELYFQFINKLYNEKEKAYKPKHISVFNYLEIKRNIFLWKFGEKMQVIKRLIHK